MRHVIDNRHPVSVRRTKRVNIIAYPLREPFQQVLDAAGFQIQHIRRVASVGSIVHDDCGALSRPSDQYALPANRAFPSPIHTRSFLPSQSMRPILYESLVI